MTYQNEPVPILFLDKARTIRFTVPAARRIKQDLGTDPLGWNKEEWGKVSDIERLPIILKALMLHEDKEITADQIEEMLISSAQIIDAAQAILRSWGHFNGMTDAQYEQAIIEARAEAEKAALDKGLDPPSEVEAEFDPLAMTSA